MKSGAVTWFIHLKQLLAIILKINILVGWGGKFFLIYL